MKKRILIIDDEPLLRETIAEALHNEGYETKIAVDGQDALNILAKDPHFDLLLLDQMMPRLSGDAFRRIQVEDPLIKDIPVLYMTAGKVDADLFYSVRPACFMPKPLELMEFLDKIESLIKTTC
jgi:CheY-like chemotaxis protein